MPQAKARPARRRARNGPAARAAGLDQSSLQSLVGYNIRRAEVRMRQHFTRTLVDRNVRPVEFSALTLIACYGA